MQQFHLALAIMASASLIFYVVGYFVGNCNWQKTLATALVSIASTLTIILILSLSMYLFSS